MNGADSLIVDSLQSRIGALESQLSDLQTMVSHSTDYVANELTAGGIVVAVVAIVVSGVLVWYGLRVEKSAKKVEELKHSIEKAKADVDNVNSNIIRNIEKLYAKLRIEETNTLINRLVEVPQDILHIYGLLTSRQLDESLYDKLKIAYRKLNPEKEAEGGVLYLTLFYQQFIGIAIADSDVRDRIVLNFERIFSLSYTKCIIKSTIQMVPALKELTRDKKESVIIAYYKALMRTEYKEVEEITGSLQKAVTQKRWKEIVNQSSDGEEL